MVRPALMFVALGWLLSLARPPGVLVTLGPQQAVRTRNALAGVHTRFTDEAEAWKIQRGLAMVREMGAPWIVEYLPWAYAEPSPGNYDWSNAERIIEHADRQGLTVIARLGFVPAWARPAQIDGQASTVTSLDAAGLTAFARFAGAFAARFKGRVRHIVIWNEPNLNVEWGMRRVDPAGYARMLAALYPAIKAANPEAIVLAGALSPTLEHNPDVALNDLDYLEALYAAGAGANFDALAIHNYGGTAPPEEPPAPDRINYRRAELLRDIMARHGDADKPAYVTESGWNDDPRFVNGVTPAQRIDYTLRAFDYARDHWPWARCVALWVFKLPAPAGGYRDHYSFVTPSLEPLPIYDEARHALVP